MPRVLRKLYHIEARLKPGAIDQLREFVRGEHIKLLMSQSDIGVNPAYFSECVRSYKDALKIYRWIYDTGALAPKPKKKEGERD